MSRSTSTDESHPRGEVPASGDPSDGRTRSIDVLVAAGLVLAVALATLFVPDGSVARLAVALPVLLVAPGYLLLQAVLVPARPRQTRAVHAVVGLGVSPAVVGLSALATALAPGGFRQPAIVAAVTVVCLALAGVALLRRRPNRPSTTRSTDTSGRQIS